MKGSSIISNLEVTNQTVENNLNVATFNQPAYSYGTFSSGSLIPINFTTGNSYKYCDVKMNFKPSNGINVYISSKDNNAAVSLVDPFETVFKTTPINATTNSVINSNTGIVLLTAGAESALTSISVINGSTRCHYKSDSVYTYAGVGASRVMGSGYFNTGLLGSISLNTTSGTLSGNYSVIKYY